jgi:hypothetical protein
MSGDPFDLGKFTFTPERIAELTPLQKKPAKPRAARPATRRTGRFVQFPYERTLAAAGQLGNAPLAVLIELAYRAFKTRQNPVPLSNKALQAVGISHWAKARALRQLESVGLVAVTKRGIGKSPWSRSCCGNSNLCAGAQVSDQTFALAHTCPLLFFLLSSYNNQGYTIRYEN